jgi:uncharacterized membrane protein
MNLRLSLQFRRAMYNLRGGFLVRPLAIALSLGVLGVLLSWLEDSVPVLQTWRPPGMFPSVRDPQVAQIILAAIAGSTMTVVSIVFAILLMTLTLASMQFSPRIIVSFVQDSFTQWTLGIFLGTFLYCMAALPTARLLPHPFTPVFTVMGAMWLAVVCVGLLLFFIYHISRAISVSHMVDRIASETVAVVEETMPWPRSHARVDGLDVTMPIWETAVESDVSGYIRFVDQRRLVELAKTFRIKINLLRRVGQFIPAGVPMLMVSHGDRLTSDGSKELLAAFDVGPARTLQQDVEFGVLQIVDIALKAISPAVNDPTTAISCIDQLSRIMIRFASREPPEGALYDPPGTLRVVIPWITFERLLESAFEQIRLYAKSDVAVSMRLLRALGDVAATTKDVKFRKVLAEQARRVVAGCTEKLGDEDLRSLHARLRALTEHLDVR